MRQQQANHSKDGNHTDGVDSRMRGKRKAEQHNDRQKLGKETGDASRAQNVVDASGRTLVIGVPQLNGAV